jgi:hypothetical protein
VQLKNDGEERVEEEGVRKRRGDAALRGKANVIRLLFPS